MKDKAEARRFKREQLRALKEKNGEIAVEQQPRKPVRRSISESVEPEQPATCEYCKGTGKHVGLFKTDICASCSGCGFDISEPLKVIQYQAAQLEKGRALYKRLGKQYNDLLNSYGAEKYKDEQLLKAIRGDDLKGRLD